MKADKYLRPIVFGITGHRDLRKEDIPKLKKKVKNIFERVINKYPNTPIILLSPLAEGADRLAAKVALEFGGIELIVPLPMPKEEYMKDFKTQESKDEFEKLLKKADRFFELPLVRGNTLENIKEYGLNRARQYEQVGIFVVSHSQILIALWDGKPKNSLGGTYQIVRYKLTGELKSYILEKFSFLESVENGLVYHILTPRKSNPEPISKMFNLNILYPYNKKGKK